MFFSEIRKSTIGPILYPENYLHNQIKQRYKSKSLHIGNVCLLKYFPKHYRNLKVNPKRNPAFLSSKVKRIKVIRNFFCEQISGRKAFETVKNLLQTTRKTLQRLPIYTSVDSFSSFPSQTLPLSQYFPRTTHLNLGGWSEGRMCLSRSREKQFERDLGYFWDTNRFIKSLEISSYGFSSWMLIRKLNCSQRLLSSLETLKLKIGESSSPNREILCEFLKNKRFLEHLTCLNIKGFPELIRYCDLFGAILKCCRNLKFLSFPVETQDYYLYPPQDFSRYSPLDLNNCFPNLQVLELRTNDLETLAGGVELSFPFGIQTMILNITSWYGHDDFQQVITDNNQKNESNSLAIFFEKWKKLESLKILELKLILVVMMEVLVEKFILPLVKAIPRLETLNCQFRYGGGVKQKEFDLNTFFKAVEPIKSLRNLRFTAEKPDSRIFSVAYNPEKVPFFPDLLFIEIDTNCSPRFDLNKFLIVFLHGLKSKPEEAGKEKSIKFSSVRLASLQDLIKLFRVLNTASQFKRLKIGLKVDLFVEKMEDLTSAFRDPVSIADNVVLKLNIYFVFEAFIVLSWEDKEYFERVFNQMEWNIFKAAKDAREHDYNQPYNRKLLLRNQK